MRSAASRMLSRVSKASSFVRLNSLFRLPGAVVLPHRSKHPPHQKILYIRVRMYIIARANASGQRSEEHTSELQSLMRISYAVFCLKQNNTTHTKNTHSTPLI